MAYKKASAILPKELLLEIQKYVQGETIYIPKIENTYLEWGARSGTKQYIEDRNKSIKKAFTNGASIEQLSTEYHLAVETIKKIVYTR
ncbi:CD3324 family protein [Lysinibacillus sp. NPDC097231]|uniref:CD3324 family protein n=1 Tax=Lysinibacillus sp. NPDC097231 TaxID=3364142 RepID=UPI00380D8B7E